MVFWAMASGSVAAVVVALAARATTCASSALLFFLFLRKPLLCVSFALSSSVRTFLSLFGFVAAGGTPVVSSVAGGAELVGEASRAELSSPEPEPPVAMSFSRGMTGGREMAGGESGRGEDWVTGGRARVKWCGLRAASRRVREDAKPAQIWAGFGSGRTKKRTSVRLRRRVGA